MNTPPEPSAVETPLARDPTLRLKRALRPLMLIVAVAFVGYSASQLVLRWREAPPVQIEPLVLALSLLPLVLATFLQGLAWIFVIERLAGHRVPRAKALALYFDSQLARYAGKFALPVVRMAGARSINATPSLVGASIALEMLSWTVVGSFVGFGLSWIFGSLAQLPLLHTWVTPMALAGSLLLLIALALVPSGRYPKAVQRFLRSRPELALVPGRTPANLLLYWVAWAIHGAILVSALGATPAAALQASGLFPLATVAGFAVLVTPGGIGMREAVIALGLTPLLGAGGALAASILSRAGSLLAEVLIWAGTRLLLSRKNFA